MNSEFQNTFNGFSQPALDFLDTVRKKNSKSWFEQNRPAYNQYLLEPIRNLVVALGENMLFIDPCFEIRPVINKTISRIFRDTRFSKDKSFFRNAMWITFKRPSKDWEKAPAYFFELSPDSYRYGMGYYLASRNTMDRLRRAIDEQPKQFLKVISFYQSQSKFVLGGEKYKRVLPNNHPAVVQDWYQRKSFYLTCNRSINANLFSSQLVGELSHCFMTLKSLYQYLIELN